MCQHNNEVQGEVLTMLFDENDMAEIVERKVWMCYDCEDVVEDFLEENSNVQFIFEGR